MKKPEHQGIPCSQCGKQGWRCLMLVRNPFDRVVSSYFAMAEHVNNIFRAGRPQQTPENWTFAQYIQFLKFVEGAGLRYRLDDHWLPQCDGSCDGHPPNFPKLVHLPIENLDAGLAWFGKMQDIKGLTRHNMSSHHYIKHSSRLTPGAAHIPFNQTQLLSPTFRDHAPRYDSFLTEPKILRDVCCLYRNDIQLYRHACSAEWLQGCEECIETCAAQLRRLERCDGVWR